MEIFKNVVFYSGKFKLDRKVVIFQIMFDVMCHKPFFKCATQINIDKRHGGVFSTENLAGRHRSDDANDKIINNHSQAT